MASLCIVILMFIVQLVANAWVLARSARAVGSSRGRFSVGLLAAAGLVAIGVVAWVADVKLASRAASPSVLLPVMQLLAQLLAVFFFLQHVFALSVKRAFAPFGAYIVLSLVLVGAALFGAKPFLIEAFELPTGGMSPTIEPGDRILVNKTLRPGR